MPSLLKSINRINLKEMHDDSPTTELSTIISKALLPASGTTRVVVKMSLGDLKQYYLKNNGSGYYVEHLTDEQVKAVHLKLSTDAAVDTTNIIFTAGKGSLSDQIKSGMGSEIAVLLDVPKAEIATFKAIPADDIAALRKQLINMLTSKNYKMSLYISKIPKASQITVGAETNEEYFNPICVANFPSKYMLNDAIEEWKANFGGQARTNKHNDITRQVSGDKSNAAAMSSIIAATSEEPLTSDADEAKIGAFVDKLIAGSKASGKSISNQDFASAMEKLGKSLQHKALDRAAEIMKAGPSSD